MSSSLHIHAAKGLGLFLRVQLRQLRLCPFRKELVIKIDGTMPEDLPTPEKSIAQLEREQMERLKQKAIDGQLILDE